MARRPYAADTAVPMERSKAQIEALLMKHGAEGFHTGWQGPSGDDPGWDAVEFLWKGKQVRFRLARPAQAWSKQAEKRTAQQNRQRWRLLFFVIKAKLEAVEGGVAVFEDEFLSFIVTQSGKTIGEILVPRIQAGTGAPALPEGRG